MSKQIWFKVVEVIFPHINAQVCIKLSIKIDHGHLPWNIRILIMTTWNNRKYKKTRQKISLSLFYLSGPTLIIYHVIQFWGDGKLYPWLVFHILCLLRVIHRVGKSTCIVYFCGIIFNISGKHTNTISLYLSTT